MTQQQRGKVDEIREKLETEQGPTAEDEEFIEQTTRQLVEEKMEARLKELKTSLNQGLDCLQELINQKIQKVNT